MSKGSRRLGRGLSSLIPPGLSQPEQEKDASDQTAPATPALAGLRGARSTSRLLAIPVSKVQRNPMQPRRHFDEQGLKGLAASLLEKGALQPVVVRMQDGGYELVTGERRLRAAKLAGLEEIPAIVRPVPDDELLELALVENIHRTDLNPIERARAYQVMHEEHHLSHEEIARRVGEDRATISNYMRLLGLSERVKELVSSGDLGVGHAKALLGLTDSQIQLSLAQRVIREAWSVRRLETAVAQAKRGDQPSAKERKVRPAVEDMEQRLGATLGTRVVIREGRRRHSGRIVVEYYSLDDFQRIVGRLGIPEEGS